MSKNRGLGRGFDSLIPTQLIDEEFDPTPKTTGQQISEIKISLIDPNPHQPRQNFDAKEISALAASIKIHGILQPLVATPKGQRYQLIAGERRLRAAKELGLASVPVIVRTFDEQQSLELALIENLQREQLNPIETATAYRKLIDQFNLSIQNVAERVGKDESTVKNTMRLLALPQEAKRALAEAKITEGHARAILSVKEEEGRLELLRLITKHGWTVRRAEEYARESRIAKPATRTHTFENNHTKTLAKYLGTTVQVQPRAKGGRLMIAYTSDEELEELVKKIAKD